MPSGCLFWDRLRLRLGVVCCWLNYAVCGLRVARCLVICRRGGRDAVIGVVLWEEGGRKQGDDGRVLGGGKMVRLAASEVIGGDRAEERGQSRSNTVLVWFGLVWWWRRMQVDKGNGSRTLGQCSRCIRITSIVIPVRSTEYGVGM